MKKGLVSIVTPMYNGASLVRQTIDSVRNQTYRNWEMIIVDDCSPDDGLGEAVVREVMDIDPRIQFVPLSVNKGSSGARNKGIECASGEYLALLDADDLWEPDFLEKQLQFMREKNGSIVFSSYRRISEDALEEVLPPFIVPQQVDYKKILKSLPIFPSTAIVNMGKIGKHYFDESMGSLRDDYVFWLKLLRKHVALAHGNQEVLVSYRMRRDSVTANKWKVIKPHWYVLRHVEKLSFFSSSYNLCWWIWISLKKYKKL